jgi:hypothetical protein
MRDIFGSDDSKTVEERGITADDMGSEGDPALADK